MEIGHHVSIISCPKCNHEKTKISFRKKSIASYTCKKCKHVCDPTPYIRQFHFRGIVAANQTQKSLSFSKKSVQYKKNIFSI